MSALDAALLERRYEAAALRLLLGLLRALDEAAPAAPEELIALLSPPSRPRAAARFREAP